MRVLVTGGTGFIGSNLIRRLLHDGHEIHLLVRRAYTQWRLDALRADLHLHEINFFDAEGVERAVAEVKPEWIFHLAAFDPYLAEKDLGQALQIDVIGVINLVKACVKVGFDAFVNSGTSQEYGFKNHATSESEYLDPRGHHALSKAAATMYCCFAARQHDVHLCTLRMYSVYGPFEQPKRLIPTLIMKGFKGELPLLVNPDTEHDFIFIDDIIEAYILAAEQQGQKPGTVYNLGTGVGISLQEVVGLARRVLKIEAEPEWGSMPNRQWDTPVWMADNRKIREVLGWQPQYNLEAGFRKSIAWFSDNPDMQEVYRKLQKD